MKQVYLLIYQLFMSTKNNVFWGQIKIFFIIKEKIEVRDYQQF